MAVWKDFHAFSVFWSLVGMEYIFVLLIVKNEDEKVEIQAAVWYNEFLIMKVCDNPVEFTGN